MEFRQLKYFLAVAEEGRFSRAAHRLHIAAPSLSQQIRLLERELQVTLFDRTPRGAELTPAGRVLMERARVILTDVERTREDVRSAADSRREQVTLRVCTMADKVLSIPLRTVGSALSGVEVFVTSSPGDDAVEAVRQARADAAVVWSRPQAHRDLDGVVLGAVLFGIVLPEGHPLAGRPNVPVEGIGHEAAVMFPWSPFAGIWQRTVDHLLPMGAQPGQVVIEPDLINSPEAMLRAVAAGSGVAPGILGVVEHMGVDGIVVLPLDPPLFLGLEIVWRRPARTAVRRIVEFLVEAVKDPGVLVSASSHTPGRLAH